MKSTIIASIKKFLPAIILYVAAFLMIRLYELVMISGQYHNAGSLAVYELKGLGYDLIISLSIASGVMLLHIILSLVSLRVAYIVSASLFTVLILVSFCLSHYFTVTLLPLSTDLYGYTWRDVITTVRSSGGASAGPVVFLVILLAGFVFTLYWVYRRNFLQGISSTATLCSLIIFISLLLPHHAAPESYTRDLDYYLAVNKTWYLADRTQEYIREKMASETIDKNSYPFLHAVTYTGKLDAYINPASALPNIVIIIVEGLGRDYTGPGAVYGGFTPYLDSLSQRSLYWSNAMSNAGRTFGALPSILGSLPYGHDGFMSYGTAMPDHQTLISLLKPHGYQSSFFYGGNPNFDNQDIFLEYQGINNLIDESKFPASYRLKKKTSSWGFADGEVFSFAASTLANVKSPRLDIYLTLTTHEPFIAPDSIFNTLVDEQLKKITAQDIQKEVQNHKGVFACLLYTDTAIRNLMKYYSNRPDFSNTIFIITGDHRLIPMPPDNQIKRFHVPLILYSPLLKRPQNFAALAIHSNITPTLLNHLVSRYTLKFPEEMPFISGPLSTDTAFTSNLDLALIRNKNEIREYIEGTYFLSDNRLYAIKTGLELELVEDNSLKKSLAEKLKRFKISSAFACDNNRVDKRASPSKPVLFTFTAHEQQLLEDVPVKSMTPDEQYSKARDLAFQKVYPQSRAILKHCLNQSPNYHDARVLLARTYAWTGKYDSAELYLRQTLERNPAYADAYVAWSDLEYWQGHIQPMKQIIAKGLLADSGNVDLLARRARTLFHEDKNDSARMLLNIVLSRDPQQEIARDLKLKLKEP
jgi:lipoteichoic acid synthase